MTILCEGKQKKTIKGAQNNCASHEIPKHLIIGVGSNDLQKMPTCVTEMESSIHTVKSKSESCNIHILPAFERVNQGEYNDKVRQSNKDIGKLCQQYENCYLIENSLISSAGQSIYCDGTHISQNGRKSFVRMIKSHLNPILGIYS